MKRHSSRILPAVVAAALVFAACGSDDAADDVIEPPSDSGLRAPVPIQITSGGGSGERVAAADESGALGASDMMFAPWITEYVVGPGMPALPTDDTGHVFDSSGAVTVEQVQQLAAALGVQGDPVPVGDEFMSAWRVGPDDGTAPSLWVSDDAQQSWNYSSAWADVRPIEACAVAVDSDGNQVGECPEPTPPVGVPTAAEAEQRTRDLLAALGIDTGAVTFDAHADDWSAWVEVADTIDPRGAVQRWSFGFGAEGVMQYASGSLATPERVGPYPLVDLDTAIARLREQNAWFGGPAVDVAVLDDAEQPADIMEGDVTDDVVGAESEPAIVEEDRAVEEEVPGAEEAPETVVAETVVAETVVAEPAPSEPQQGDVPAETIVVDPPMPEPMPDETVPGEAPESVTVTLVDVQADFWWAWDVDGSAWLLPAYRFIDTDGGWHTVPAVTDEFMIQVEPPVFEEPVPLPEPMPVETVPVETVVPEPLPPETIQVDPPVTTAGFVTTDFDDLVGLPLEEFMEAAKQRGAETRVVLRDGVGLAGTADFNPSRVNVEVTTIEGIETVGSVTNIG